jgi:gamma-glutamyl-gamma-aminobutyrate hydrolase PuuD
LARGDGVVERGWAVGDGIIEAIEVADATLALGVQWHPEANADSTLIGRFVAKTASGGTQ